MNITVKNVPKDIVQKYWEVLTYDKLKETILFNNDNIVYWNDEEINNMWKTSTVFSNSF